MRCRSRAVVVVLATLALAACDYFVSADTRVARAQEYIQANEHRAAMIELKKALDSEPENARAHVLLAEVSYHFGDYAGAEKEIRRANQSGAAPTDLTDLIARVRLAMNQPRELLAQIDGGELPVEEPQRSIYRGRAFLMLNDAGQAKAAFNTALASDAQSRAARLGLAEADAIRGDASSALERLANILEHHPADSEARLLQGSILARQGRFAEAEASLQAGYEQRSSLNARQQAMLLSTLAETQLARGALDAARATHKSLAEVVPTAPVTLLLSARIHMTGLDYAAAIADLQRLLAALPDFTRARFLLGASLLAQGNLYQAESHLARVVQKSPENLEARKLLARVRLRLQQPEGAVQALMGGEATAENDSDVNALLGLAHLQLGDTSGAAQFLKRDGDQPNNRDLQLELAATYLRLGEGARAIAMLRELPHLPDEPRREAGLIAAVTTVDGMEAGRAELDRLLAAHPKSVGVLNVAGLFYARRGEFERARPYLARALAVAPQDATTMLNAARVELAAGNAADATARLQGVIAAHPDHTVARLALAELSMRTNDLRAAAKYLEEVRKLDPDAVQPRLALARVYLLDKRVAEGEELLQSIAALAEGRPDVQNAMGLLYLELGRYEEAASRFQLATSGDGVNATYWMNLAQAQLALDRNVLARESLERAKVKRPGSTTIVGALAMLDLREGKREAATRRIAELRKERPRVASVDVLEGDLHMTLKEFAAAADAYQRALSQEPSAATTLKAYRARQLGHLPNASAPLEAWLSKHPEDLAVQAVLAETYQQGGQHQRAIEIYELIASNRAGNAAVLNNLAWLYYLEGDARAEATARRAYQAMPANPAIADTYGWILVERGRLPEGLNVLAKASEAASENSDIAYHYAAALARSGRRDEARSRLQAILDSNESFATQGDARRLLQDLTAH